MPTLKVTNKRQKISPGGIVTLPVSARKSLGVAKGAGTRVSVAVKDGAVVLAAVKAGGFRVSAGGQLVLRQEARQALEQGAARHFELELDDKKGTVTLRPYR